MDDFSEELVFKKTEKIIDGYIVHERRYMDMPIFTSNGVPYKPLDPIIVVEKIGVNALGEIRKLYSSIPRCGLTKCMNCKSGEIVNVMI